MFKVGAKIVFHDEPDNEYTVQAMDFRYAVLTRPMNKNDVGEWLSEDDLDFEAVCVYTILDNQTWMRGPHDRIANRYEFKTKEGCEECLSDLAAGKINLSVRRSIKAELLLKEEVER